MRFKYALTAVKMAASMCRKRKRVVLSLANKLSILDRLAKGEKATKVASEFGIGNSTVTDLKESRIRGTSVNLTLHQPQLCRLRECETLLLNSAITMS